MGCDAARPGGGLASHRSQPGCAVGSGVTAYGPVIPTCLKQLKEQGTDNS